MTGTIALRKLTSLVSSSAEKIRTLSGPLIKVLTFSPADDVISPAKNVSVSIGKGILSVVYGARILSRIRIKGAKRYPLEERFPTPDSLASSLEIALSQLGASKKDITLCVPKAWVVIKTAEFPSTVRETIADVVSYELDRLTPFSPEEAYYDFRILKEQGERLTLSVAAVKNDLITPYIEKLREKGYFVKRVTVDLSGIGTFCSYANKFTDFLFIKIGEDQYEGAVFSDGSIAGAFTGSLGTEDEGSRLDTVLSEIEPYIDEVKREGKSPRIIASFKDKNSSLREMLKLRIPSSLSMLDEMESPLGRRMEEIPYEAIGGVLESVWPKARGLNLLKKGYQEKEKKPFALTVILVIMLLCLWVLYMMAPVRIEENRLKEIQRQVTIRKEDIRKVEALKKEIEGLEKETATINNFKEARPMSLNIVRELTTVLPKTTWLTRTRITELTIEIEGYAGSASELIPKLEASKYFKKAEFASPTFRDVRMNADRFNIKMEIEGVKKEEKKDRGEQPKNEKKK